MPKKSASKKTKRKVAVSPTTQLQKKLNVTPKRMLKLELLVRRIKKWDKQSKNIFEKKRKQDDVWKTLRASQKRWISRWAKYGKRGALMPRPVKPPEVAPPIPEKVPKEKPKKKPPVKKGRQPNYVDFTFHFYSSSPHVSGSANYIFFIPKKMQGEKITRDVVQATAEEQLQADWQMNLGEKLDEKLIKSRGLSWGYLGNNFAYVEFEGQVFQWETRIRRLTKKK